MASSEIRSAIMLVLAMVMVVGGVAHAVDASPLPTDQPGGGGEVAPSDASAKTASADAVRSAATVNVFSPWTGNASPGAAGFFATEASGFGTDQRAVMPGYQSGGTTFVTQASSEGATLTAPVRGRPVRLDNGIFLYPAILIGYGRNDNVTSVGSNKIASNFFMLRPELVGELKVRDDRYTLAYAGNYGRYQSSSQDDYDDHELWLSGDNYFTRSARLGWGAGYIQRSDPRGSTNAGLGSEPDRWHAPVVRGLGVYGAPGAIARIELEGSWMQKRYDNNRNVVGRTSTELFDVDLAMLAGRFYYRLLPKTSLLVEARNTWANYVSGRSTSDNTDTRLYGGFVWEATAQTSATLKFGRAYKRFSDASREDASMNSWEALLRWSPRSYSTIDFVASRAPVDATGVGNFVLNNAATVLWNHRWAGLFSSRLSAGVVKTSYDQNPRSDSIKNYGVGVYRELGARLRAGVDWFYTDRNSNENLYDFKRNIVMLTIEGTM